MKLEIRNLQSSATYQIAMEGAILGREGSKADIVLRDQAVSKKHAKIYMQNGRWYLEDLASSNGTFIENRRITEPVVLSPGSVFALSENQFEVVQIINNGQVEPIPAGTVERPVKAVIEDLPGLPGMHFPDPPGEPSRSGRGGGGRSPTTGKLNGLMGMAPEPEDPARDSGPDEAVPPSLGSLIGQALSNGFLGAPRFLFTPRAAIRRSIEAQPVPVLGPGGLIAYALPALLFALLFSNLIALAAGDLGALPPLSAADTAGRAGAAIGASIVLGFAWHPVTVVLIDRLLKGTSDDRGRSNLFAALCAALMLFALPGSAVMLSPVLVRLPAIGPFVNFLHPILMLVAIVLVLVLFSRWLKYFGVVARLQHVFIAVAALALIGPEWVASSAAISAARSSNQGGNPAVAAASGAGAQAQDRAGDPTAKPEADKPPVQAEPVAAAAAAPADGKGEPPKNETPPPAPAGEAPAAATPAEPSPRPAFASRPTPESPEVTASLTQPKETEFTRFLKQRDECEREIADRPDLLKRNDVLEAYKQYLSKTYEIRQAWAKKKRKGFVEDKINEHLKNLDVFQNTRKLVNDLCETIAKAESSASRGGARTEGASGR